MTAPAAPPTTLTTCKGEYVLALPAPGGGYRYEPCPGCLDCDRDQAAPALPRRDAFGCLPAVDDWRF